MFKFLKDKLKSAISKFSQKVEKEAPEETFSEEEQVPEEEVQKAQEIIDRVRGEVRAEEVFQKATGIPAAVVLKKLEEKEELESALAKAQEEEPQSIDETREEKNVFSDDEAVLSEDAFLKQEEVTEIEDEPSFEEVPEQPSFAQENLTEHEKELASDLTESLAEEIEQPEEVHFEELPELITDFQVEEPLEIKKGFFEKLKEKFTKKKEEKKEEVKKEKEYEETIPRLEELYNVEDAFKEIEKEPTVPHLETSEDKIAEEELRASQEFFEKETTKEKQELFQEPIPTIQELTERKEQKEQVSHPKKIKKEIEEPKGFFSKLKEKIVMKKISEDQFDELFWDLEVALLENNVALEVIEKIKQDLKKELIDVPIKRSAVQETIVNSLKNSLVSLFEIKGEDLLYQIKKKSRKPFIICFVGINGSGKTTTIAKVAHLLKEQGYGVVLAAADTFRAAAIDQLQEHADKLHIKLIKHDYGSDAAAVAFDAIKHAEAKNMDVVLIDTAGRLHSNTNLVDEMKKIVKVAKPDLKIFVGESITGNDCVEQAVQFNEAIGIDGIILAKADIDEKGGAAISISFVTQKPILYLGTGQRYTDLKSFDPNSLMASLGL